MAKFEKLRSKADNAIKENNIYEALQIYRTVRNRCKDEVQAKECLEMLYSAAIHFGVQDEKTTVLDLAEVYADTLVAFTVKPSDKIYEEIGKIFELLPMTITASPTEKGSHDLRSNFVNDVFKWSKNTSTRSFRKLRGDPKIHQIFARIYWAQGDSNVARLHFLLANDPETFSQFLIDYTTRENRGENDVDDYIVQAVFLLLAYKKLRIAQTLFTIYCRDHPQIRRKFPFRNNPVFNFIWLLFAVLQTNNFNAFVYLVDKYRSVLHGDCEYREYLDKVGQVYFKIPPKNEGSGLLGGLLKGLLSKGATEPIKEDFSADEEMSEQATKCADQLKKVLSDFDALNSVADKANPEGLIIEPNMESMFKVSDSSQKPSSSKAPTEMDLD